MIWVQLHWKTAWFMLNIMVLVVKV
jgi:hypothetical protein